MRAVPTTERELLRGPARRTAAVAAGLALGLLAVGVGLVHAARGVDAQQEGLFARGESAIVVVDLSLSIPAVVYRRMREAIEALSESEGTVGLIIFSDSAYELLPPGTPSRELRPLLRFLTPAPPPEEGWEGREYFLPDPWSDSFRSGTRISAALELAREVAERDRVDASVLLLSDLHTAELDHRPLQDALVELQAAGIQLRVVPLFPLDENRALFAAAAGEEVFSDWQRFVERRRAATVEATRSAADSPLPLLAAGVLLLMLLAANEAWCRRVELGAAR